MSPEGTVYSDHLEDSIRGSQAPSLADWQADCPQYSHYRRGQFDGPRPSRGNLMQTFLQFAVGLSVSASSLGTTWSPSVSPEFK